MRALIRDGERVIEIDTQGDVRDPDQMARLALDLWRTTWGGHEPRHVDRDATAVIPAAQGTWP